MTLPALNGRKLRITELPPEQSGVSLVFRIFFLLSNCKMRLRPNPFRHLLSSMGPDPWCLTRASANWGRVCTGRSSGPPVLSIEGVSRKDASLHFSHYCGISHCRGFFRQSRRTPAVGVIRVSTRRARNVGDARLTRVGVVGDALSGLVWLRG